MVKKTCDSYREGVTGRAQVEDMPGLVTYDESLGRLKTAARSYVFGDTLLNDISARDNRRAGQWIDSEGRYTCALKDPAI